MGWPANTDFVTKHAIDCRVILMEAHALLMLIILPAVLQGVATRRNDTSVSSCVLWVVSAHIQWCRSFLVAHSGEMTFTISYLLTMTNATWVFLIMMEDILNNWKWFDVPQRHKPLTLVTRTLLNIFWISLYSLTCNFKLRFLDHEICS